MCMPRDDHNWIENREFRTIMNLHILNPLPELQGCTGIKCSCATGQSGRAIISPGMPYHLLNCMKDKASVVQTHNDLEQELFNLAQMAGTDPKRDRSRYAFLGVDDPSNARKVDIVVNGGGKLGCRHLIDVVARI